MIHQRASQSPNLSPNWRPPRAPLPPHRLAKLANALGVSTPVPASIPYSPSPAAHSPTPSRAPSPSPSITSRFLLHVLPPLTFPYASDEPPPSTASGYHTHFRRGILVPVYSSFQSQLSAIAKEYALPSTAGLILYLIDSPSDSKGTTLEEPGPRLSDDIWRHIWTRVIQVEQRDDVLPAQGLSSLRTGLASRSTPHLLSRPPVSAPTPDVPNTSPSTPSTAFSHSKYVADSSPEDPETPDTSAPSNMFHAQQQAQSLDLPGLHSPSFIPILAKVEFDVDRRKAVWYEPWLRTRKANHAKRAESRAGKKGSHDEGSESQERQPPIQLIIGRHQTTSPLPVHKQEGVNGSGYQQLPDSSGIGDEDGSSDEEAAVPVALVDGQDPLEDVFGTDGDAWADIHATNSDWRSSNPNIVDLALTAADLSVMPNVISQETDSPVPPEEEEVRELLKEISRPNSTATATGVLTSPPSKRSSSSTHTAKKSVPPPLVLVPKDQTNDLVIPSEPSPMPSTPGSVGLAYLNGNSSPEKSPRNEDIEDEFDDQYSPIRSSTDSEKRAGTIYDDLDLGLGPADDFDENDPNDRRRSQFLFKAKLDEIERTMAQLSPRMLDADLQADSVAMASFSPKTPNSNPVSPAVGMLNADYYPPSPFTRAPLNLEHSPSLNHSSPVQGPPRSSSANATAKIGQAEWPAVPFSSVRNNSGDSGQTDDVSLPPQLAVNGVTTSAPKSYIPPSTDAVSVETERRKRELEKEHPALAQTSSPVPENAAEDSIIPLSPDPFARYSSSTPETMTIDARLSGSPSQQWETVTMSRGSVALEPVVEDDEGLNALASQGGRGRSATVSRFSADSVTIGSETAKPSMKTTLMTVRSIKKLWRKSNNKSSNTNNTPVHVPIGRNSPQVPPTRPERPSDETMDLPDVQHPLPDFPPNFKGYSSHPNSPHPQPPVRMSLDQHGPSRTSQDQYSPSRPSYDQMNTPNIQVPQNLNVPQSKPSLQVPLSPNPGAFPPILANSPPPNHPQGLIVPPQNHPGGLSLPAFVGRNGSVSPIVAAQMLPRGASSMNRLQFDQESPYPVHMPNSPRYSPRAVSPPSLPAAQVPLPPSPAVPAIVPVYLQVQQQPLPSPIPEKDKLTGRKSILKAFQKSKQSPVPPPTPTESRSSVDKLSQSPSTIGNRPRRPSFHSTKSSMTSVSDLPPSPHIPERFLEDRSKSGVMSMLGANSDGVKQQSRLTTSSTDSAISQRQYLGRSGSPPPLSTASSRSSIETRPSFDTSQFEIVSPKTSTLTYPYHNLDHQ